MLINSTTRNSLLKKDILVGGMNGCVSNLIEGDRIKITKSSPQQGFAYNLSVGDECIIKRSPYRYASSMGSDLILVLCKRDEDGKEQNVPIKSVELMDDVSERMLTSIFG